MRAAAVLVPALALGGVGAATAACEVGDRIVRATHAFTDDEGRTVEIPTPSHLSKVYFSGPIGQIMLFAVKPEIIAGTTLPFTQQELSMLPAGTEDLPFMGSLSGGDGDFDIEALREEGVQLVLSITGDDDAVESLVDPDAFQEQVGIPVVCLHAGFDTMGDAFRKLGSIVGSEARAEEVAQGIFHEVRAAVARIPVEKRVKLYYAEGAEGLQTESFSSSHAHTFGVAGAYNVAKVKSVGSNGKTQVKLSQVRKWDPDVIVAWSQDIRDGADQLIRISEEWKGISAVDSGRVYTMPNVPYSWCDRPAGPNRCIGIQWIANLLYPEHYPIDMVSATKEFYRVMWRLEVSDDQVKELLGNSYRG